MIIQHNLMALNAHRQLGVNNLTLSKNLEKLASGYRVNRAADDAAGLAISEKMRAQITGITRAALNSQDGISLIQTAEGALQEVHSILNRLEELAVEAANGLYDKVDRQNIQAETAAMKDEINRITESANFNGIKLLNGNLGTAGNLVPLTTYPVDPAFTAGAALVAPVTVGASPRFLTYGTGAVSASFASPTLSITVLHKDTGLPMTVDFDLVDMIDTTPGARYTIDLGNFGQFELENGDPLVGGPAGLLAQIPSEIQAYLSLPSKSVVPLTPAELLDAGMHLQIGDSAPEVMVVTINDMSVNGLELNGLSMLSVKSASKALNAIKDAINTISSTRGDLGGWQNRLEHTINNLGVMAENMTQAESRIRDVDMAKEMMLFTKNSVLSQSSQAMLAQANTQPQQILQLLQ